MDLNERETNSHEPLRTPTNTDEPKRTATNTGEAKRTRNECDVSNVAVIALSMVRSSVVPAKAGTQSARWLDARLRGHDGLRGGEEYGMDPRVKPEDDGLWGVEDDGYGM
jgi:hypothetical protein